MTFRSQITDRIPFSRDQSAEAECSLRNLEGEYTRFLEIFLYCQRTPPHLQLLTLSGASLFGASVAYFVAEGYK